MNEYNWEVYNEMNDDDMIELIKEIEYAAGSVYLPTRS